MAGLFLCVCGEVIVHHDHYQTIALLLTAGLLYRSSSSQRFTHNESEMRNGASELFVAYWSVIWEQGCSYLFDWGLILIQYYKVQCILFRGSHIVVQYKTQLNCTKR